MRGIVLLAIILLFAAVTNTATAAVIDTAVQKNKTLTRFYLPGSIGVCIPSSSKRTQISNGFSLNTAAEYRFGDTNGAFIRFNYDALNNHYTTHVMRLLPTNIITGKLTTNFFVLGAGYRHMYKNYGFFALVQPGISQYAYERADVLPDGVNISYVTNHNAAFKTSAGFEYYIERHLALTFESAYYKLFSNAGFSNSHSHMFAVNIGITTTLF